MPPPKSAPFSLRLSGETDRLITAEARRTQRSKGHVIVALAEEALKARLVPGVAFRGEDYDRRAWVMGTGLDVWQVIEAWLDFGEDESRILRETDLDERALGIARAYYARFREEVDERIAQDRVSLDDLRRDHPGAAVITVSPG